MAEDAILSVVTPIGFQVRVTLSRWETMTRIKHPIMHGRQADVQAALREPDEVRRSRSDSDVLLFYRLERPGRWICAVVKVVAGEGFLITAYPTDAIKVGEQIWSR